MRRIVATATLQWLMTVAEKLLRDDGMKAWRRIFKDRVAGAGLLAILVQLLLFQAVVTSFTCSTMTTAAAAQGPAIVICHGAGTEPSQDASNPIHRSNPNGVCFDCPCGVSCNPSTAIPGGFTPGSDIGPAYTLAELTRSFWPPLESSGPVWPPLELKPDPTGPPSLSV